MSKPQFSDQDVENLARLVSRCDGAMGGQAGWDFLHSNARTRYRTYARAILRAGYRLPTERASMHARLNEVVARLETAEAAIVSLGQQVAHERERITEGEITLTAASFREAAASVAVDRDPRGARTVKPGRAMRAPVLTPVCQIPDCGCSGAAHP